MKYYQEAFLLLWMPQEVFQAKQSKFLLFVGQAVSARAYSRVEKGRVAGTGYYSWTLVSLAIFLAYCEAPQ